MLFHNVNGIACYLDKKMCQCRMSFNIDCVIKNV